jgi:epoxide hydrolase 4
MRDLYLAFLIPGLSDWLMGRNDFAGMIGMLKKSGKPGTFSAEDLDEYRKAYTNSGGLTGMINWYRALFKSRSSTRRKAKIKMPVLILWGKQDLALGAEMAEKSLDYCENGELVFFENATHWVQHDEAEAVNKHLLEFFK